MEKQDKRTNILSAAEQLFSEMGYEGTSTRQIAKEAGANMSMISYYFGSKEGVFLEIMNERIKGFNAQLVIINEDSITPHQKLMRVIEEYTTRILTNISFHKMMHRELSLAQRPEMYCKLKDAISANLIVIEKIINEGIAAGTFRSVDVRMLIATIMGTITSVATTPSKVTEGSLLDITIPKDREILTKRLIVHLKDLVTTYLTPQK
jgi:AcrR family transcriptional regulator